MLAVEKLSRPQVVKKLWEYIREHQLQNPSNKKEILCDGALRAVFAVDKIDMFRMNKVLGQCVASRQRRSSHLLSSQTSSRGIIAADDPHLLDILDNQFVSLGFQQGCSLYGILVQA